MRKCNFYLKLRLYRLHEPPNYILDSHKFLLSKQNSILTPNYSFLFAFLKLTIWMSTQKKRTLQDFHNVKKNRFKKC